MGRPTDYSSPQRQGRKVPQVHRLRPFVMLTPYPKSAACSMARHKHFPENFQGVVIPLHLIPPFLTHTHTHTKTILIANSTHNSPFFEREKWVGEVGCWVCISSRWILNVLSVIFYLTVQKYK